MLGKSESLIIGYDESDCRDYTCLTVARRLDKDRMIVVNTFFGKEAEELYEWLTKERPAQLINI